MCWRRRMLNAGLVAASIACTYLAIESLFFRVLLPYVSLNIKTHLPDTAGVLVQNPRSGLFGYAAHAAGGCRDSHTAWSDRLDPLQ